MAELYSRIMGLDDQLLGNDKEFYQGLQLELIKLLKGLVAREEYALLFLPYKSASVCTKLMTAVTNFKPEVMLLDVEIIPRDARSGLNLARNIRSEIAVSRKLLPPRFIFITRGDHHGTLSDRADYENEFGPTDPSIYHRRIWVAKGSGPQRAAEQIIEAIKLIAFHDLPTKKTAEPAYGPLRIDREKENVYCIRNGKETKRTTLPLNQINFLTVLFSNPKAHHSQVKLAQAVEVTRQSIRNWTGGSESEDLNRKLKIRLDLRADLILKTKARGYTLNRPGAL